jgi:hypothetical protein
MGGGSKKGKRKSHKKDTESKNKKKKLPPKERYESGRHKYAAKAKDYYSGQKYVEHGKRVMKNGLIIPQKPYLQPVDPYRAGMLYGGRNDYNLNAGLEAQIAHQQKMSEMSTAQIALAQKEQELKMEMLKHEHHLKLVSAYGQYARDVEDHMFKVAKEYMDEGHVSFEDLEATRDHFHRSASGTDTSAGDDSPPPTPRPPPSGPPSDGPPPDFTGGFTPAAHPVVPYVPPAGRAAFTNAYNATQQAQTSATPRQETRVALPREHEEQHVTHDGRPFTLTIHADGRNSIAVNGQAPRHFVDAGGALEVIRTLGVHPEYLQRLERALTTDRHLYVTEDRRAITYNPGRPLRLRPGIDKPEEVQDPKEFRFQDKLYDKESSIIVTPGDRVSILPNRVRRPNELREYDAWGSKVTRYLHKRGVPVKDMAAMYDKWSRWQDIPDEHEPPDFYDLDLQHQSSTTRQIDAYGFPLKVIVTPTKIRIKHRYNLGYDKINYTSHDSPEDAMDEIDKNYKRFYKFRDKSLLKAIQDAQSEVHKAYAQKQDASRELIDRAIDEYDLDFQERLDELDRRQRSKVITENEKQAAREALIANRASEINALEQSIRLTRQLMYLPGYNDMQSVEPYVTPFLRPMYPTANMEMKEIATHDIAAPQPRISEPPSRETSPDPAPAANFRPRVVPPPQPQQPAPPQRTPTPPPPFPSGEEDQSDGNPPPRRQNPPRHGQTQEDRLHPTKRQDSPPPKQAGRTRTRYPRVDPEPQPAQQPRRNPPRGD